MKALIVYESMYGNTRSVAEAIADVLAPAMETVVRPAAKALQEEALTADLLVLGAPTHAFGLPRPSTRKAAAEAAAKPGSGLHLEPDAAGEGLREWLVRLGAFSGEVAVFDTRMRLPGVIWHASRSLRRLSAAQARSTRSKSFLVSKNSQLLPGELDRARSWASQMLT